MSSNTIGVVLAGIAPGQLAEVTEALSAELKKRTHAAVCIVTGAGTGATPQQTVHLILEALEKSGAIAAAAAQEPVYSPDEEEKIRKRLEDLGYL